MTAVASLRELVRRGGGFAWHRLPPAVVERRVLREVGRFAYRHVTRYQERVQTHSTWFMRNPPMYDAVCEWVARAPAGALVRIASAGCSTGAELYSVLFLLRRRRPDLRIEALGFDLSAGVVEAARAAVYRQDRPASVRGTYASGGSELDRALVPPGEWRTGLFEEREGALRVRDPVRAGTRWETADASDPSLLERLGPHDVVLANNFLGPMPDPLAAACLRNVARLVGPGGLLVVDGVDLDVKQRVLGELRAVAVLDRLQEIYDADPTKRDWPWTRWSHEPIDRTREDWARRYGTLFVFPQG